MKFKNKKVMAGMKAMAVVSMLSMTIFSYSYNIVLAEENSHETAYQNTQYSDENTSKSDAYSDDSNKHDSEVDNDSDTKNFSHSDDDSSHASNEDKDSKDKNDDNKNHGKTTICHATHSDSNPFVEITISNSALNSHEYHQDKEDIIPAPKDGCPKGHDSHEDNQGDHNHGGNGNDGDNDNDDNGGEHDNQNSAPVITLIGNSTVTIYQGQTYTDLGATANDKEDGDITANIVTVSNVDTSTVGTYTVTYNVKDSKGVCSGTVTRTVVVNPISNLNTAPVITLLGLNPITVTQGDIYLDPGATANDLEDGDITANIVKTGSVDTGVVGTYTITYNVSDSKGLSATAVTRTVNVVSTQTIGKGKITFCLVLGNDQNVVATSSYALPQGTFEMSLGTSTGFATSTLFTKTWDSSAFAPNQKAILGTNDSDCVTYGNLDFGTYNYNTMSVNGSTWNAPMYNDQNSQPVNNVFDFFPFTLLNDNSDGVIIINSDRPERTLYVYDTYKAGPMCELPEITSGLTASVKVNQNFSLALNASSTSSVDWTVATTSLPVGLSYATSTNTISGTPTVVGTYNVALKATNTCGFTDKTLVITVSDDTTGGGGSTPNANLSVVKIANRGAANAGDEVLYTITLENKGPNDATNVKVTDILPAQLDFVSASTTVGAYATSTGVWLVGNFAFGSSTSLVIIGKVKSGTEGQNIANTATVAADQSDSDTSNNTSTVNVGVINPNNNGGGGGGGGGNGPIAGSYGGGSVLGTTTTSGVSALPAVQGCNYLLDYLRSDFDNKPFEVLKLQLFLKNLEGFSNLPITSVYDQATIDAVNTFQMRYKGDVLTPWGHTAPTSYVYILTKKKVNEIYCKMAFPVTADQQMEIDNYRNSHKNTGSVNVGTINIKNNEVGYGSTSNNVVKHTISTTSSNTIGYTTNSSSTSTVANVVSKTATSVNNRVNNVANVGLTTLAGFSSSTKGLANDFVANIISSAKKIGSLLGALFTLPSVVAGKTSQNSCQTNLGIFSGLNLILFLLVVLVTYFWYREHRNNKKIEEINKEIDLQ